ncbi:MAG TPA: IS110 family transposase [Acidobacteriaceae bacterium]|jgi:transposase|nr:IS110 family transposase [Acidobacteriaceae bacterium]
MIYRVAAIDVHKKMLAVVVADVAGEGEYQFERRKFGTTPEQLELLTQWLVQQEVEEVVMESTAEYWRPVWGTLEQHWQPERRKREGATKMSGALHLCQAKSNRGRRGRKSDFTDAERMVKRLVAQELVLSFVPDPEQRLWRTVTRRKYQLTRDKVRFQNQLESLLEQAHIKLSSWVSDLLGLSARRMLQALAEGETDPAAVAALADQRLRATPAQLRDALGACAHLHPVYRRLLKMALEELKLLEEQIAKLDGEAAELLQEHQEALQRLAEVPGLGVSSAVQIVAEVGPEAKAFESAKEMSSWVGVCPGSNETAGEAHSTTSPKGNQNMRRLLNQAAQAAVKVKGSIFEITFRKFLSRGMEYKEAIWAIAHRLCRLIWLLLRRRVRYEERGPAVSAKSQRTRTSRMIKELRKLGYRVDAGPLPASTLS